MLAVLCTPGPLLRYWPQIPKALRAETAFKSDRHPGCNLSCASRLPRWGRLATGHILFPRISYLSLLAGFP